MKRIGVSATIRLDAYKIIDEVIDRAIRYGYRRAHKHVNNPSEESLIMEIHNSVMNDLNDVLKFDEES
ncbi:MAG: hypothetical protein EBU90_23265 [Proteobacteria bacterium]|jgi:hypothetical protein|nr:hypothetical protein [Pseudomonadota bacterium]